MSLTHPTANSIPIDIPENICAQAGLMRDSESTLGTVVPTWLDAAKYRHSHDLPKQAVVSGARLFPPEVRYAHIAFNRSNDIESAVISHVIDTNSTRHGTL